MTENDKDWKELLNKLDHHEAPDQFDMEALSKNTDQDWTTLLNKLPAETAPEAEIAILKEARSFSVFKSTSNWIKIAASLLILVSIFVLWPMKKSDPSIVLSMQEGGQKLFAGSNQESTLSLDEFCAAYEIKCDQYELEEFRTEWEEVSSAIITLLGSLEHNQYDEFLLRQLSVLEARHAELVNELLKIVWS